VKALKMQLRMSARVLAAAGVLALATVLSSCGFDYATDRVYTPGAGVNDRDASVDVLAAVVVSAEEGSGTFIASFANNDQEDSATVTSVAGAGESSDVQVDSFQPIQIAPGQLVNLATDDAGIVISGDSIEAGDFVTLEIGFGDGDSVQLDVPILPPCHEYEGLDKSTDSSGADECTVESPDTSPEA
jgi:hypothetical protein